MGAKIEIDLADLGWNDQDGEVTIRDLVLNAAVERVVSREMRSDIQKKVSAIVEKEATGQVRELVAEVITGPIQPTTPWGERKGEPTTIREIIRTTMESYLKMPTGGNRWGNSDSKSLAGLIEDATRHILTGELASTVKEAKATIHETVSSAALAAAVKELSRK